MIAMRRQRQEAGHDVAKNAGLCFKTYYLLEKRQKDPLLKNGAGWREIVHKLCDYWSCEPEDIFPEAAKRHADRQPGSAELLLSSYARSQATPKSLEYACLVDKANQAFNSLNSHDRTVISAYVIDGMATGRMAKKFRVTETTIHNWVYEALRTLRYRAASVLDRSIKIVNFLGTDAYYRRKEP